MGGIIKKKSRNKNSINLQQNSVVSNENSVLDSTGLKETEGNALLKSFTFGNNSRKDGSSKSPRKEGNPQENFQTAREEVSEAARGNHIQKRKTVRKLKSQNTDDHILEELRTKLSLNLRNKLRDPKNNKRKAQLTEEKTESSFGIDPLKFDINYYFIPRKTTVGQELSDFKKFGSVANSLDGKFNIRKQSDEEEFKINPNLATRYRRTNVYDRNSGNQGYLQLGSPGQKHDLLTKNTKTGKKLSNELLQYNETMELRSITTGELLDGAHYFSRHKNIDRAELLRRHHNRKKIVVIDEERPIVSQSMQQQGRMKPFSEVEVKNISLCERKKILGSMWGVGDLLDPERMKEHEHIPQKDRLRLEKTFLQTPRKLAPSSQKKKTSNFKEKIFNFEEENFGLDSPLKKLPSLQKLSPRKLFTAVTENKPPEPKKPFITLYDKMALSILKQKINRETVEKLLPNEGFAELRLSTRSSTQSNLLLGKSHTKKEMNFPKYD